MLRSLLFVSSLLVAGQALAAGPLVVYSERREPLLLPILDVFTAQTGIQVDVLSDQGQVLIERLAAEGTRTRADVLITVDAGNLWQATQREVLQPVQSPVLEAAVPAEFRDPEGHWFAITERARVIVHSTERLPAGELTTYEALADEEWKGRLCLRSSRKVYNQSLVAMMIDRHGEARTEQIVRGWVANLAAPPFGDDTQLIEAIAAGQCDVGIVNTYYFGRLQDRRADLPVAVFYPNQGEGDTGVHVNVTGAGVVRHSRQPERAQQLIEWLLSEPAQRLFADIDFEFPVNPSVPGSAAVSAWGSFRADARNIAEAGRGQAAAVRLMDRAGYR